MTYAPFWDHVEQLRRVLLRVLAICAVGFCTSLILYRPIFQFIHATAQSSLPTGSIKLVLLGPLDGFKLTLKIALWVGVAFTSPVWLLAISSFIQPGLRTQEKRVILPLLVTAIVFLAGGIGIGVVYSLPLAVKVLYTFNTSIGDNLWSLSHYIDFTIVFLVGHAIAFEAVATLLTLVHFKVVSAGALSDKRRVFIIVIFAGAAVLTPPDVVTQLMLAVPLVVMFEICILYARFRAIPVHV